MAALVTIALIAAVFVAIDYLDRRYQEWESAQDREDRERWTALWDGRWRVK